MVMAWNLKVCQMKILNLMSKYKTGLNPRLKYE